VLKDDYMYCQDCPVAEKTFITDEELGTWDKVYKCPYDNYFHEECVKCPYENKEQ
jgi:hypothetical protein